MKPKATSLSVIVLLCASVCLGLTGCTASSGTGNSVAGTSYSGSGGNNTVAAYAPGNTRGAAATSGDLKLVSELPPADNTDNGTNVPLAVGDLLEVSVFQVPDLTREVRVAGNGTISLPLIGTVKAAGMTADQFKNSVADRYRQGYLQSPEVSVLVKESMGQRVTMEGAFTKPGVYQAEANATLLRSVALASGLNDLADEKKLFVYRTSGGVKYVANYNLKDIRKGIKKDPRIYGGDIVVAFQSNSKVALQNLKEGLGMAVNATRIGTPF